MPRPIRTCRTRTRKPKPFSTIARIDPLQTISINDCKPTIHAPDKPILPASLDGHELTDIFQTGLNNSQSGIARISTRKRPRGSPTEAKAKPALNQKTSSESSKQVDENVNMDLATKAEGQKPLEGVPAITGQSHGRNKFTIAKQLFHRSAQVRIVGRSNERAFIYNFWTRKFSACSMDPSGTRNVLYLAGNPGTGKTALIDEMLPELCHSHSKGGGDGSEIKVIKVNCMMFTDPRHALTEIAANLGLPCSKSFSTFVFNSGSSTLSPQSAILSYLYKLDYRLVIVLDEIDQLAIKDRELFASVMNWPQLTPWLLIIGIANALDLVDKYIPAFSDLLEILYFIPYSVEDITAILKDRLTRANSIIQQEHISIGNGTGEDAGLIHPMAIELCARKVAAIGDLRKALEIMRMAIELAEQEEEQQHQKEQRPLPTSNEGADKLSIERPKIVVGLKHIVKALERASISFGGSMGSGGGSAKLVGMVNELGIHQKVVLVSLVLILRPPIEHNLKIRTLNYKPTLQQIFERYTELLKNQRITEPLGRADFFDLVNNLESLGLIGVAAATSGSGSKHLGDKKERDGMGGKGKWEKSKWEKNNSRRNQRNPVGVIDWSFTVSLVYGAEEIETILREQSLFKLFLN